MSPATLRHYRHSAFASHLFLLILTGWMLCVLPVQASEWSYKDGSNGPNQWPGICQAGSRQSPIDLDPEGAVPGHFGPLVLVNYDRAFAANITNNGHTVVLNVEQPCDVVMAGAGLPAVYHLEQIHFHWKSEHTLQGKRWPLEMHLVHYDRQFKKFSEAAKHKKGLAVLGVLFYETTQPNEAFSPIVDSMSKVSRIEGTPSKLLRPLMLQDLIPQDVNYFYHYDGSLTTPNCAETVVWTVLVEPVPIGGQQVAQFYKVESHNKPLTSNYRPVQKLHKRRIYLQRHAEAFPWISASSRLYQSYFTVTALGIFSMAGQFFLS